MQKTPLPLKTMSILCAVIVSEPISLTLLFPFIYYMVRDFGYRQEEIGYYVGWIASSFSLAQFMTAYGWGFLSDRIGRRPVLLIGLIGNSISTCLFGLSKNLLWAVLSRSICGVLNGKILLQTPIRYLFIRAVLFDNHLISIDQNYILTL